MSLLSFADAIYRVWLQMHGVGLVYKETSSQWGALLQETNQPEYFKKKK